MIKAELIDSLGDDLRVVNAARVSFDKESVWDNEMELAWGDPAGILKVPDKKLLAYLASYSHFTPFTHCQITLREHVPIFVARQRFKHVVGFTYNEVSRRYVSDDPEFFEPEAWRLKADNVKQGSSSETVFSEATLVQTEYDAWEGTTYRPFNEIALEVYQGLLRDGVCPEQARMVLPQSMMTSYYVTGSLMAFARAYKQRSDTHSQLEIQVLAKEWDRIIRPLFPEAWAALCDEA